jgi:phospholipid/cholesterol/gamma-HCH transport system substrate-binding protein
MRSSLIEELVGNRRRHTRTSAGIPGQCQPGARQRKSAASGKTLANLEATTGNANEVARQLRELLAPENLRLLMPPWCVPSRRRPRRRRCWSNRVGLMVRLQPLGDKLDRLIGEPSSGGIAALVSRLNEVGSDLSANSRQLNRVLQMLEESPQSLDFGPPASAPGPGEPGFVVPPSREESR